MKLTLGLVQPMLSQENNGLGGQQVLLSGDDWQLVGFAPGEGVSKEVFRATYPLGESVAARVPGDIHWDLERAKVIPNLYYGMNTKEARWVTGKEWWYQKKFNLAQEWQGKNLRLRFEAVDYLAEFWLNGHYLGKHEGQFTPFEFVVTDQALVNEENTLTVLIHPVPEPVREVISKESAEWDVMNVMRPAYPYWKSMTSSGWDWGADLVSMGIWQDVWLVASKDVYLSNLTVIPEISAPYKKATLKIKMAAKAEKDHTVVLQCQVRCLTMNGESLPIIFNKTVAVIPGSQSFHATMEIDDPQLWWPNGYGDQNLYELSVAALDAEEKTILNQTSTRFGIRELKMLPNPRSPKETRYRDFNPDHEAGRIIEFTDTTEWPDYLIQINGVRVMGMGANWIPSDLLFGRADAQTYEHLIRLAAEANMNLFRIWGGGLLEKQSFFDLCDRYGIMLIAEFPNGGPRLPETDKALEITGQETRALLPLMINHPSVVRYGGGNEMYITAENSKQMAQLRRICNEMDPSRPFHDPCPETLGQRHGPHGYLYPQHYNNYNTGYPLDAGSDDPREWNEYGAAGASSIETLKRIMPEENCFPIKLGDPYWIWHKGEGAYGADNWLGASQYTLLFGALPDLQTTVACSQLVQAEGMRYANQSMRRNMWHRSAFASWTFNEPWPNAAHGCLVEYYGKTKMAYYFAKHACSPVDVSLVYDDLECRPDKPLVLEVWVSNITAQKLDGSKYRWRVFNTQSELLGEQTQSIGIQPEESKVVGKVTWVPQASMDGEMALVYLELLDSQDRVLAAHLYTFGIRSGGQKPLLRGMLDTAPTKLEIKSEDLKPAGQDQWQTTVEVKNTGDKNALYVALNVKTEDACHAYFDDNYFFLLPDQTRKISVNLISCAPEISAKGVSVSAKAWNSAPEIAKVPSKNGGDAAVGDITGISQEPVTRKNSVVLENKTFRLKIDTGNGLNPYSLFDKSNNIVLANQDYYYGFGRPQHVEVDTRGRADGGTEYMFTGDVNGLLVSHVFLIPSGNAWFEEYVVLKNMTDSTLNLNQENLNLRHGFTSGINATANGNNGNALSSDWLIMAVPYLLNTESGKREEYNIGEFVSANLQQIASEGWVMTDGRAGCLVLKYSQRQMEFSLINNKLPSAKTENPASTPTIVWGGSGMYRGDPEAAMNLMPNQTLQLGLSRYTSFTGDWKLGYRLFRDFMDTKGHRFADDFNPPVHWNEIYDNALWWDAPDTPDKRAKYYQLEDMEKEAAKAVELGCEAIYLDPGWDTEMGSTIWAEDRLLTCREFCKLMKGKYGLKVALHTPLAVWNKESTYPESARKPFPVNDNYLCSGAWGWKKEKLERLLKLASDGIDFFMFDGTNFTGPCEVKEHGHSIPYTREEHMRNYAELARKIKDKFPDVLIEMHDPIVGPTTVRFVPTYYTHSSATYDTMWAFEYMWDSMSDLLGGVSRSLYYYNLACNIPLYLHVNLKTDNKNALMFWWYASTCRHLGVGGRYGVKASPESVEVQYAHLGIGEKNSPPSEIWEAHKKAMVTYMQLKPFFARGDFYGIDELTHVHTLPEKNSSVINCFNMDDTKITKKFFVPLIDMGLHQVNNWQVSGADDWKIADGVFYFSLKLPAMAMRPIKITPKQQPNPKYTSHD